MTELGDHVIIEKKGWGWEVVIHLQGCKDVATRRQVALLPREFVEAQMSACVYLYLLEGLFISLAKKDPMPILILPHFPWISSQLQKGRGQM